MKEVDCVLSAAEHASLHEIERASYCKRNCSRPFYAFVNCWARADMRTRRPRPGYIECLHVSFRPRGTWIAAGRS